MKIDTSLWESEDRMRIRIKNLGSMVLSITAVNGFITYGTNWFIFGINCLFFITTVPLFMSYSKWQKEPPKYEDK